jgi:hypothetical protein
MRANASLFRVVPALALAASAHAANIGGRFEQQSRAELASDECPEFIALASRTSADTDGAASLYYASALCDLYSDKLQRDPVAAAAWPACAGELDHPLARRTLLALREPAFSSTAGAPHPTTLHCHDLGEGRKLCHAGAPR